MSDLLDFTMKCKPFPLQPNDEIQLFKLKIKKQEVFSPKIEIQLFRGAYHLQKMAYIRPMTQEFNFFKFPLWHGCIVFQFFMKILQIFSPNQN